MQLSMSSGTSYLSKSCAKKVIFNVWIIIMFFLLFQVFDSSKMKSKGLLGNLVISHIERALNWTLLLAYHAIQGLNKMTPILPFLLGNLKKFGFCGVSWCRLWALSLSITTSFCYTSVKLIKIVQHNEESEWLTYKEWVSENWKKIHSRWKLHFRGSMNIGRN